MIEHDFKVAKRDPRKLLANPANARKHPPAQIAQIRRSIREHGFASIVFLKDDGVTIGMGHGRCEAAIAEGLAKVPTAILKGLSEAQWRTLVIADNRLPEGAEWDFDLLRAELGELEGLGVDLSLTGFSLEQLGGGGNAKAGSLLERFGLAPFSVLNAREGWWQDRKRAWIALGIRSELGRGENLLAMSDTVLEPDPVKRAALQAAGASGVEVGGGVTFGKMKATPGHPKGDFPGGPQRRRALAETSSLKGGLTVGTTMHPYDATGAKKNARATRPGALYDTKTPAKDPAFYTKKRKAEAALGREIDLETFRREFYDPPAEASGSGTSVFDPVLAELAYRWFSPPGGVILDPFAGGSVRGIVAGKLGREYVGIDLSLPQVEANRVQAALILDPLKDAPVTWLCEDSAHQLRGHPHDFSEPAGCDFIFSCPPYFDLEVYSEDPRDLSTMQWEAFLDRYELIVDLACRRLRDDRFAAFVVGDVRDPAGAYRGFHFATVEAFRKAGLRFYNHAILVTAAGSLAMRAGRAFETSRKLGKTHQDILVFVKGDPVKAAAAIGRPEFGEIGAGLADEPDGGDTVHVPDKDGTAAESESELTPFGERLLSLGGEVE